MNVLLRSVTIINGNESLKGKKRDLLIRNGVIEKIGEKLEVSEDVTVFERAGACVSVGWLDMKANFRDPGNETEEDLVSGLEAAKAGGYTGVVLMPSTHPPVQSKADVEYLIRKSAGSVVSVYPAGALSVNREGKDVTEMYDMKMAGAVAFTDDKRSITDSGLMLRALQYSSNLNTRIISYADDSFISGKGQVNEGVPAVIAGLKGAPSFAEELMVYRDIRISAYTGVPVHFATLSSAESVNHIRTARADGLKITAEVTAHHLFFDDSSISGFDTNYKVKPPFRSNADKAALIDGVADGTITVICSDHSPEDTESKEVEFDFAAYGIIGLESAFGTARSATDKKVSLETLVNCFSVNPRNVLGLGINEIKEGSTACLTIFDPDIEWTFGAGKLKSRSSNSPFIGMKLKGRALAVYNNGQFSSCI
ncbi:MAG TPA: dihydroorotase [Bacteroidia bacterium]|nr:dihydroorotase [Bacteroidia bacterium]